MVVGGEECKTVSNKMGDWKLEAISGLAIVLRPGSYVMYNSKTGEIVKCA